MESWDASLQRLTEAQRERLETPDFFERLQTELSQRFYRDLFPSSAGG